MISVGEVYVRHRGVVDGSPYSSPECLRCERVRRLIYERELSEGCRPGESWCPLGEIAEYLSDRGMAYDVERDALVGGPPC